MYETDSYQGITLRTTKKGGQEYLKTFQRANSSHTRSKTNQTYNGVNTDD